MILRVPERRSGHRFGECLAGAERGSRVLPIFYTSRCERVRTTEHAPRNPFHVLERGHSLADIIERGNGGQGDAAAARREG